MNVIEITDASFETIIKNTNKVVAIDFGAEWCPPCKAMVPVMGLVAQALQDQAIIAKLDVDANPETTAKYGVRNLPTFLFFKDGTLVDKVVGAVPRSILEQKIRSLV